jgi:Fe-S cluster assembly iron-binding protein IscA
VTTTANANTGQAAPATTVVLTDVAASKVRALLDQEGRDDLRLRVAVQPGGCSGLRYQLFFDERALDGDVVTRFPVKSDISDVDSGYGSDDEDGDGDQGPAVEVVVDRMSAPYLAGATIDFADRIDAQGFTIDNPNAQGSCACGDSFH